MTLLEDIQSGKYNLVLFGIILVLFYQCYSETNNKTTDYFGSVTTDSQLQETVTTPSTVTSPSPVNTIIPSSTLQVTGGPSFNDTIYYANIDDIQKVSRIINKIESDGLIFNGKIKEAGNILIPTGSIIMWSGINVPTGWALCDGQNGTPNLQGRFILGAGKGQNLTERVVGQIGGLERVTLALNEIPTHAHNITYRTDDNTKTTTYRGTANVAATDTNLRRDGMNKTTTSTSAGSEQTHENMPPFYVLGYIMKL